MATPVLNYVLLLRMSISGADSDDVVGGGAELADSIMAVLGMSPIIDRLIIPQKALKTMVFHPKQLLKLGGLVLKIEDSMILMDF